MIKELNIVRLYIYNENYRLNLVSKLSKDLFSDEICADLFELAHEYYLKNRKMPDNIKINIINNPWNYEKEIVEQMINIVNVSPEEYNIKDIREFLDDTGDWWKKQKMKLLLQDSIDILKGRKKFDTQAIHDKAKEIDGFSYDDDGLFSVHDDKLMLDFYLQDNKRIKFNSDMMNEVLNGGMIPESLNIIIAGTHVGKTRLLVNMACDFMRKNYSRRSLYISMEQSEEQIASYIDMNYLNISTDEIRKMVKTDAEKYKHMRDEVRKKIGDITIKRYSSNVTTSDIRNYIKKMVDIDKRPDCIFLDYIQLIKPAYKCDTMWEIGDTVSKEVRAISQEFQIPIWTAAQIKVDSAKRNTKIDSSAGNYDISGSKAYSENADLVMNVIQDSVMKRNGTQIFTFPKNRHNGIFDYVLFAEIIRETYKVNFTGLKKLHEMDGEDDGNDSDVELESDFSFKPKLSF